MHQVEVLMLEFLALRFALLTERHLLSKKTEMRVVRQQA